MLIEVYRTNFMITIFKRVIVGSRTLLVQLNLSSFSLFNSFVPKFRIGLLVNARYNLKLIFHSLSHFAASSTIIFLSFSFTQYEANVFIQYRQTVKQRK